MREVVAIFLSGERETDLPKLPSLKRQNNSAASEEGERAIQFYQSWFPNTAPTLPQHQSFKCELMEWLHERIMQSETTVASIGTLVARVRQVASWADVAFRLWRAKQERQLLESATAVISSPDVPGACFELYSRFASLEAATNGIIYTRILASLGPLHGSYCVDAASASLLPVAQGVRQSLAALAEQSLEKYRNWFESKFLDAAYLKQFFGGAQVSIATEQEVQLYFAAENRFAQDILPKSSRQPYMTEVARCLFSTTAFPLVVTMLIRERSPQIAPIFDAIESVHPKNTQFAQQLSEQLRLQFQRTDPTSRYFFELVLAHQNWVKQSCRNRAVLVSAIDDEVRTRFRETTSNCTTVCRALHHLRTSKIGGSLDIAALVDCGLRAVSQNFDAEEAVLEFCRLLLHRIQCKTLLSKSFLDAEAQWVRTLTSHFGARAYPAVLLLKDAEASATVEDACRSLCPMEGPPQLRLRFYSAFACPPLSRGILCAELRAMLQIPELVYNNCFPKRCLQWVPSLTVLQLNWHHRAGCTSLSVTASQYHLLRKLEAAASTPLVLAAETTIPIAQVQNGLQSLSHHGVVVHRSGEFYIAFEVPPSAATIDAISPLKNGTANPESPDREKRLRTALDIAVVRLLKTKGKVLLPLSAATLPAQFSEVSYDEIALCVDRLCQRDYCTKVAGELRYVP